MLPFLQLDIVEQVVLGVLLGGLFVLAIASLLRGEGRLGVLAVVALVGLAVAAATFAVELAQGKTLEAGPDEAPSQVRVLFAGKTAWQDDLESEWARQWEPLVLRWVIFLACAAAPVWILATVVGAVAHRGQGHSSH